MSGLLPFPRDGTVLPRALDGRRYAGGSGRPAGSVPERRRRAVPRPRSRGDSAFDVSELAIRPSTAPPAARVTGCFGFDFRFLSEEYPARLGSPFNDALRRRSSTTRRRGATVWRRRSGAQQLRLAPRRPAGDRSSPPGPATMSPAEAAGTPYGAATALLHAQMLRCRHAERHARRSTCRSSTTATTSTTARSSSTISACTAAAQSVCPRGRHVARPGRRDHGPDDRGHRRHADADAHGHGGNARRRGTVTVRIYAGPSGGGLARADAARRALGQHVVRRRGRSRARPVHRPGHADQRPGHQRRQRADDLHGAAARGSRDSRARARASSRPPETATATASPTTRTRRTARCRRSPARRSMPA